MLRFPALLALVLVGACSSSHHAGDGSVPPRGDGGGPDPTLDAGPPPPTCVERTESVDLLFVIDDSGSMVEEQASLAEGLPRLVHALVTGDRDGDGTPDFTRVGRLQVGVVTTDMGTGGFALPTCREPDFGDDGLMQTEPGSTRPGCAGMYPPFVEFGPDADEDPAAFAHDVSCLSGVGTAGCGFEQPLEAALKALTPSTSDLSFYRGTRGHGDREHDGFVDRDSVLAVVFVTDEEDCSLRDPELLNPSSALYSSSLNLRCFSYPEAAHPIERYVDGLSALRPGARAGRLVLGVIAGVPPDLAGAAYDGVLGDVRMQETVDPSDPNRLTPSCDVPGRGLAFPPRRMVRLAQQLETRGARATVQSICQADFGPAIDALVERIAAATLPSCI